MHWRIVCRSISMKRIICPWEAILWLRHPRFLWIGRWKPDLSLRMHAWQLHIYFHPWRKLSSNAPHRSVGSIDQLRHDPCSKFLKIINARIMFTYLSCNPTWRTGLCSEDFCFSFPSSKCGSSQRYLQVWGPHQTLTHLDDPLFAQV